MASYTPPTISGYNATPPPDDGSESGNNELSWSKHINKIGDPLKDFSEAIDSATTTAFTTVDGELLTDSNKYAVDTGAADAYVVALSPALTAYTAGHVVRFKATNANTGASTINVNGLGVKSITTTAIGALTENRILANGVYTLVYDGTQYQLQEPTFTRNTFVDIGTGEPAISLTTQGFTQATLAVSTWEGVGPTASGEPNIWTALDGVPSDVDWIEAFIEADVANTAASSNIDVFMRANGSSSTFDNTTKVATAKTTATGGAVTGTSTIASGYIKIPVVDRVFDIAVQGGYVSMATFLRLTGYGYN
jgi:hypothetical protein